MAAAALGLYYYNKFNSILYWINYNGVVYETPLISERNWEPENKNTWHTQYAKKSQPQKWDEQLFIVWMYVCTYEPKQKTKPNNEQSSN